MSSRSTEFWKDYDLKRCKIPRTCSTQEQYQKNVYIYIIYKEEEEEVMRKWKKKWRIEVAAESGKQRNGKQTGRVGLLYEARSDRGYIGPGHESIRK